MEKASRRKACDKNGWNWASNITTEDLCGQKNRVIHDVRELNDHDLRRDHFAQVVNDKTCNDEIQHELRMRVLRLVSELS